MKAGRREWGKAPLVAVALLAAAAPLRAQNPGGRWHTLETAHFRVHVRPAQRELGVRAAGEAEAAWTALAALLPAPRTRIELVVSDDADAANGYATTYPVPTVVVFAFPPAGDVELGSYDRWLRLVVTHELAHIFHLDLARGWWGVGRRLFGRVPGLFPNLYSPTWLVEGAAVFLEARLTGGGRLDAAFHRAVVNAAFVEGRGMPMDAANGLTPRWPAGVRPYAFGATFVGALAAAHGDSVLPRLMLRTARRPLPYVQLNGALRQVAGESFGEAWRGWADGRTGGRAESDGRTGGPADETTHVSGLRTVVVPRVSADGRRVLFVDADGREAPRVAMWERDSGRVRRLARVNSDGGVAWDGDEALVAQLEFTDPYTMRGDLWRLLRSGDERRVTRSARLREPDVGPGGAVVAVRAVPGGNELVLLERGTVRALVASAPGTEWSHPRWSPDGGRIAVARTQGGRRDIVLLSPAGELIREVTRDRVPDGMPVFTPDGALLLWTRDLDGVPQIVGQRLDDGALLRFTDAPFAAYAPAPAADSLFYLSYHHDGFRLVSVPLVGEPWAVPEPDSAAPEPAPPRTAIVAEHGYRAAPALVPRWALPSLVSVAGGGGTFVGVLTSGADPLGRHAWIADVGVGVGKAGVRGRWRGTLAWSYAGFAPAVLDLVVSRDQLDYLAGYGAGGSVRCCLTEDAADLGVTLRRRRFRSLVGMRVGAEYDRSVRAERAGAVVSASASRLVAPAQGISVQQGWRLAVTVRRRWRQDLPRSYTQATVSGAVYAPGRMLGWAREVFVARGAFGVIGGTDSVRLGVGGVSSGLFEVLPGVDVGGGGRLFPVRGYPGSFLAGRKAASVTLEVRSPLAMVGRGPGLFPPVTLDRVSMALFADGGLAWHAAVCPVAAGGGGSASECPEGIASLGGELVIDAGVPYDFPVRFRLGTAWRLTLRSGAGYAAVGATF